MGLYSIKNVRSTIFPGVLACIIFLAYYETVFKFEDLWAKPWNSHSPLLFIFCMYLFFKEWVLLKDALTLKIDRLAIAGLFVLSMIWLASRVMLVQYVEFVAFTLIIILLPVVFLGWSQSKLLVMPLSLLLFTSPLFSIFVPILQDITAVLTGLMLQIFAISSVVEGVLILIPSGTFVVDESCSGLSVLTVGVILAMVYSYLNRLSFKDALFLIIAAIVVSILSNVVRVFIIVVVGNETQMQHSLVREHGDLGWIVFAVMYAMFSFLAYRFWLSRDEFSIKNSISSGQSPVKAISSELNIKGVVGIVFVVFIACSGPLMYWYLHQKSDARKIYSQESTLTIPGWPEVNNITTDWQISYRAGADEAAIYKVFEKNGKQVHLRRLKFFTQTSENEAISSSNEVYQRKQWVRVWDRLQHISHVKDLEVVQEVLVRKGSGRELLIWRWYESYDTATGNPYMAKLYNFLGVLSGRPEMIVYMVATDVNADYEASRAILSDFLNDAKLGVEPS